ncbi:MAG: SpoVR family protein [Chloroflexi bacterium]|nr:SpoVR family protein [Chloroflexota bacterium]
MSTPPCNAFSASRGVITVDKELATLEKAIEEIWQVEQRMGLDPFPMHFEVVPPTIMYEFGAYGLPGHYSHWTHGKAYHQMKTLYDYGLSKIYELVINANPCYAFLLGGNSLIQNKLVIAHAMAHSDFFKNNVYFKPTSRHMVESASISADRIRHYEIRHGVKEVENFLDAVLSIHEHIDPYRFIRHASEEKHEEKAQATPYEDLWQIGEPPPKVAPKTKKFPPQPEKDLLLFIMENAPDLEHWQRDIISIVREESLYFLPQMQTKILNEGWAAYWHTRVLRELELTEAEYTEFAALHSSVTTPSKRHINPYYVGLKMLEDIFGRWETPAPHQGRPGGGGTQKLFEVREMENDVSFFRTYLTKELVGDLDLYLYRQEKDKWVVTEKNWERVRDTIVNSLTNMGFPYIVVEDGDYHGKRELYLKHSYEGQPLDLPYAEKTLSMVYTLWGRPVHLETVSDQKPLLLTCDGEKITRT